MGDILEPKSGHSITFLLKRNVFLMFGGEKTNGSPSSDLISITADNCMVFWGK